MDETRVLYKALADFSSVRREARSAAKSLTTLKAAEDAYNASSAKSTKTAQARAKAIQTEAKSLKDVLASMRSHKTAQASSTVAARAATKAIQAQNRALVTNTARFTSATAAGALYRAMQTGISRSTNSATRAIVAQNAALIQNRTAAGAQPNTRTRRGPTFSPATPTQSTAQAAAAARALAALRNNTNQNTQSTNRFTAAIARLRSGLGGLPPLLNRAGVSGNGLYRNFQKFANWRPRLVPPFVALIPIIGAVIAAMNPLLALIGAVSTAAFGLGANIASLSGAFVALPGILAAVVGGIASVVASMGGVGNVFKTYAAMQKATGATGGGGESASDRADRLADAEDNLAKSQRNVTKAQERLNDAREEALQDLIDLRLEVSRASMNEERAIANLVKAREAYNDVMADPGSTRGDKLDAAVDIKEAEADLADIRKQNIKNQKDLNEAEKKGVANADKVLDAQESLDDAIRSQRDATKALKTEQKGGSAAATAINEYQEALSKLSPSARAVVLALIGMQDQWNAMRSDLQENFFSQFADGMDRVPRIIQNIGNFLRPAARAMGQFVDKLMDLLSSPEWTRDLARIGEQNGSVISNLADAFLSLAGFFKDVVLAAGPFTEWMTSSWAEGAENMRKLLDTQAERDGFAGWLDLVRTRLEKWWQIVKNVGVTLFNYGSAASGFGDWLSDGFLATTESWRRASEDAKKDGSPFKEFLEDIKPLLSEVNGLFGDFFGWLSREIMDPDNIEDAQDLVKLLRDDLGPAIGTLLDTLAETDIDEAFVGALTSIVESLTSIMEVGGNAGLKTFFDVIAGFFEGVANFLKSLPPGSADWLVSLVGALAAIALINKFTGVISLFTVLGNVKWAKVGAGLSTVWGWLGKIDKMKFATLIGKGGIFALAAAGVVSNIQSFADQFEGVGEANKPGSTAPEKINALTENGRYAKSVLGPLVNFGAISEVVGWFSPEAKADLDKNLEGISQRMLLWLGQTQLDMTNFGLDIRLGWESFWSDVALGWLGMQTEIQNGWTTFSANFGSGWNNFWGGLRTGFQSIVDGLGTVWSGIQSAFATPVNWVIENVWNNGIAKFWNDIASKLGIGIKLGSIGLIGAAPANKPRSSGGGSSPGGKVRAVKDGGSVLPGYTPGRDVHTFTSSTAGTLKLSGGEGIMVPEFVKSVGGVKGVNRLNKDARKSQRFANGGVFGSTKKSDLGGDIWNNLTSAVGAVFSGGDPVGNIANMLKEKVSSLMGGAGGSPWAQVLGGIPNTLIGGLVNQFKSWFSTPGAESGGGANPIGWQKMWAAVSARFPGINLNDALRPGGTKTATGSISYHGAGRAIDVTPSMEVFDWLKQNFPQSRELIYSPAGNRQLYNGREHFWGEPVRSAHFNHVHWAMKNGGVFDQGGWLKNGGMALNRSGKPEAVLDPMESRGLKALASGAGLARYPQMSAFPQAAFAGGAGQTVDNSVNIGEMTIVNPTPEPVSKSVPKAIREVAYMNSARGGG